MTLKITESGVRSEAVKADGDGRPEAGGDARPEAGGDAPERSGKGAAFLGGGVEAAHEIGSLWKAWGRAGSFE
ncbi:hypothetical protein K6U06_08610 [Acidiferrimicrobium sp. IK]|uniref:hypothetical protein n=1 Tax=Acidiferrimicrobium sp. IK TaxID=2871700 RepID=UPI0021CB7A70|nr:hypothetical protein [Acidiferrimicrobium sp. IK]MCU4184420.1 hypothetical protein [Acidiferrimicrobium sp. IK]